MGLRQLAVFDAIARRESFRGAARELGYVQSAVSRQIARLERTVGAELIQRGRGRDGVTLTPAGELFAEHGGAILVRLRAAKVDLATTSSERRPTIHAGLCAGVASWLVPRLLDRLEPPSSDLRVEFLETADEDLLPWLVERGALDVAIGVIPAGDSRFAVTPLLADPWVLIAPADSLLAHREQHCSPAELRGSSLLLPPPSRATELAVCQLEAAGVSLRDAPRAPTGRVMKAAVVARKAVALTPTLALVEDDADTAVVTPGVTLTAREIGIYWNAHRRAVAPLECLLGAVQEALDERGRRRFAVAMRP